MEICDQATTANFTITSTTTLDRPGRVRSGARWVKTLVKTKVDQIMVLVSFALPAFYDQAGKWPFDFTGQILEGPFGHTPGTYAQIEDSAGAKMIQFFEKNAPLPVRGPSMNAKRKAMSGTWFRTWGGIALAVLVGVILQSVGTRSPMTWTRVDLLMIFHGVWIALLAVAWRYLNPKDLAYGITPPVLTAIPGPVQAQPIAAVILTDQGISPGLPTGSPSVG